MGYAWAPQITGLVRGEPKPGQRHRSNGKAILMEFCEERASKSPTLDRSRSGLNLYTHRDGEQSGTATWEAMCAEADEYRSVVKLKNGKTAERGLRADAVIGWAMIIKPPAEMIAGLGMSDEDIARFVLDGFDAMCAIEPRLFRPDTLTVSAWHVDEDGMHAHFAGTSKDKAGKYCGNLLDAALCNRINQQFPALMRGMGWPIDDLDVTDWDRAKTDEAYRAERDAKRKRQGRSVGKYVEQRAAEAGKAAARIVGDAKAEAQQLRDEAKADAQQLRGDADEYARRTRRKAEKDAGDTRAAADQYAGDTRAAADRDAARILDQARDQAAVMLRQRDEAEAERDAARKERDEARADRDRAKAEADDRRLWAGKLYDAQKAVQTALQGDLQTMEAKRAEDGAKALLDALGATVRPLLALNAGQAAGVNKGISSAMDRLAEINKQNEARWAAADPSVEWIKNVPLS